MVYVSSLPSFHKTAFYVYYYKTLIIFLQVIKMYGSRE